MVRFAEDETIVIQQPLIVTCPPPLEQFARGYALAEQHRTGLRHIVEIHEWAPPGKIYITGLPLDKEML